MPPADPVGEPRNRANVEALETALATYVRTHGFPDLTTRDGVRAEVRDLAKFLAARGVLVPAAMSDKECDGAISACERSDQGFRTEYIPEAFRAYLERIARGEP